jgi:Putative auto-transporter adhesin, head GIN domain
VKLKQGADESVTVEADDNVAPHLTTEVRDGVLYLGLSDDVIFTGPVTLRFEVVAKTLTGVQNSGLGLIKGEAIDTPALAVDLSGGGQITLQGKADAQRVSVSGLGMINLSKLAGRNGIVTVSGAGEARVNVTDTLKAEISGLGSVRYAGWPSVERTVSGGGDIRPIE